MLKLKFIDDKNVPEGNKFIELGKIYDGYENDRRDRYILILNEKKLFYKWRFENITRKLKLKKLL